jgi:hypothetical protein
VRAQCRFADRGREQGFQGLQRQLHRRVAASTQRPLCWSPACCSRRCSELRIY